MFFSKLYNQADDSTSIKGGPVIRRLDTSNVGDMIRVTSISYSDQGFVLTGFEDGSIGLYHTDFSNPISIWYNACETAVEVIKWCTIYFSEGRSGLRSSPDKQKAATEAETSSRFASRLCEFFVIDKDENFYIWNLNQDIHKSKHKINFAEKHGGIEEKGVNKSLISTTCPDQSFYTGFSVKDHQVVFYFMNFKKGSKITKDKIDSENRKSIKLLKIQPN